MTRIPPNRHAGRKLAGLAALAALALAATAWAADAPLLEVPIDCQLGRNCSIQNYVDDDPGPAARDFTCGLLTYDGHKGTDFRLPDYVAMDRGVAVLAAAPGVVLRLRDNMEDASVRVVGKDAIKGREAGNSVIIDLGGGWETQYGHMRKGSIVVKPGQVVAAGQKLGLVGLSGDTEFPHVHFELRYQGKTVDPFLGLTDARVCGKPGHPLWSPSAASRVAYQPTGLLNAGFAPERPDAESARHGAYAAPILPESSPALIFWVDVYGVQRGDRETFEVTGPDGGTLVEANRAAERTLAVAFRFAGKKQPAEGWPAGAYRAEYRLVRSVDGADTTLVEATREVEIR